MNKIDTKTFEIAQDLGEGLSEQRLWARMARASSHEDFAATWLQLQARLLQDVRAGVLILGKPETGPFVPVARYPPKASISTDLSTTAEMAMADRKGVAHDRPAGDRNEARQCVALPIIVDEEIHGVAAFDLEVRSAQGLSDAGRRLQWGTSWIELMLRRQSLLPNRQLIEALDVVAIVLEAPRLAVALQSLTVNLARVLKAEWVACGLIRRGVYVNVEATSQIIVTSGRPAIVTATAAAMQEAADQQSIIQLPERRDAPPVVTQAHRRLAEQADCGGVLSVPIAHGDAIAGVLTVASRTGSAASDADREFLRLVATMAGPAIHLRARDDRWLGAKAADSGLNLLRKLVGPRHPVLKLGVVAFVAACAYLSVGTATDRVTAAATVEGTVQRAITVPIAGYIASQGPRAGDRVAKGDILAKLDDNELQVQLARATSEREQHDREYQQAFAAGERSRVEILKAQIVQSQAQIDLLNDQISRVEMRSPIDGIIVQGDLSQMIGAPVQRGDVLFEIAPLDDYRIVLKVDERDAASIQPGQEGRLILSSLPSLMLPIRVSKLTPVSLSEEGRNYFRIEAMLESADGAVRPGMQGYGKIDIGQKKVVDIASARILQWLRMTAWRFWF